MTKKLAKLGLADLSVEFPEKSDDEFVLGSDGLYRAGEFPKDSFPVTEVTDSTLFKTTFSAEDNSISAELEGRFLCFNTLDNGVPIAEWKSGYVWGIRLKNDQGKLIKKPKDEWGMSTPIEALAEKGVYGGGAYQVSFSIHVEADEYIG